MDDTERMDVIEGTDEDGNRLMLSVEKYFFYNGEEYVLLRALRDEPDESEDGTLYVMKVEVSKDESGEEVEDFLPVEEELMDNLIQAVSIRYNDEDEIDVTPSENT